VGQSLHCLASFEGQTAEGTAELETDELRFRGAFRLKVPLREVRTAVALDGRLEVTFDAGTAVFDLGPKAKAWADRILHPPSLLDKLGVRAGQRVGLVGLADRDFRQALDTAGVGIAGSGRSGGAPPAGDDPPDLLFLGAAATAALDAVPRLSDALPADGALWIVYPKGRREIREADVLAAGRAAGLTDVKVARFSETHTALKFVVPRDARATRAAHGAGAGAAKMGAAAPGTGRSRGARSGSDPGPVRSRRGPAPGPRGGPGT
jgi:hypothetical protein